MQLKNAASKTVINKMKSAFSRHGIPEKVVSDNGPQEFSEFAEKWDFIHNTSSLRYPQSNGLAEKTVQTVKRIFDKSEADGQDPYLGILAYRSTPLDIGQSPSQLLMGRTLRTTLPVLRDQLNPKIPNTSLIQDKMEMSRQREKKYYDLGAKPFPYINIGEYTIFQQDNHTWKPAVVTKQVNSRSYVVKAPTGNTYRRNRRHHTKSNESPPSNSIDHSCQSSYSHDSPSPDKEPVNSTDTIINNQESNLEPQNLNDVPVSKSTLLSNVQNSSKFYVTRSGRISIPKVIESV